MKKIRTTLDNDKLTCRVLLEFQKAFDIVNHKVRTFEFEYHDIRGMSLIGLNHIWQTDCSKNELKM